MSTFTRAACVCRAWPLALLVAASALAETVPEFRDRTAAAGLDTITYSGSEEKPHILESTGNGVLVLDYDGDGHVDLFFVSAFRLPGTAGQSEGRSALWRNQGDGTFVDVTAAAGLGEQIFGQGGVVGDIDNDGLPDIYLTAFGANLLFRNRGDGTFVEVAEAMGVADPRWSIGAVFFDGDQDGDQDLFVANYIDATWNDVEAARRTRMWRGKVAVMDGPRGLPESANAYYRNLGDGTFEDATEEAGFAAGGMGYSMAAIAFDYDNDADVDLYVANDSTPNRLYRNLGNGTFEEIGTWAGVAYDGDGSLQGSMGAGFGDYDGDGWLDLAVTNFAHDHYTLYRNAKGEFFTDESFATGVAQPTFAALGWSSLLFDADNDADLDLFFSNGHIYPQVDEDASLGESFRQENQLLVNDGGAFGLAPTKPGDGLATRKSSRGAATLDYDNDGDLDLVVSNQDEAADLFLNETDSENHWLRLALGSKAGWAPTLGGRVEVAGGAGKQIREIVSALGYASQSDDRAHFGLGRDAAIERLSVRWPAGGRTVFLDLPADRSYGVRPRGADAGGGAP